MPCILSRFKYFFFEIDYPSFFQIYAYEPRPCTLANGICFFKYTQVIATLIFFVVSTIPHAIWIIPLYFEVGASEHCFV